jgi:hypothetical protein
MLNRLFPRQIDNAYRGHVLAIWLFVPVVLLKLVMGFNVAGMNPWVSSRFILQRADGVPVDSFPPEAAAFAVFSFAAWGLALFVLALLSLVVLLRYRAMLPLMILAMTIEQVGRKLVSEFHLAPRVAEGGEAPAGMWINLGLSGVLVLALVLSLMPARKP